jgi:hypothetical protein
VAELTKKLGHFSKTDIRYWQDGLFQKTHRKTAAFIINPAYARLQHQGRRERFPLYTPNKSAAAAKARDIYLFLSVNRWIQILAKFIYRRSGEILTRKSKAQGLGKIA